MAYSMHSRLLYEAFGGPNIEMNRCSDIVPILVFPLQKIPLILASSESVIVLHPISENAPRID